MAKEITNQSLTELLEVAENQGLDTKELANIIDELTYVARDNDYNDSMLCDISDLLYNL